MSPQIKCPTCAMTASLSDHRLLAPVGQTIDHDERRCRNCGDVFEVSDVAPNVLAHSA